MREVFLGMLRAAALGMWLISAAHADLHVLDTQTFDKQYPTVRRDAIVSSGAATIVVVGDLTPPQLAKLDELVQHHAAVYKIESK